VVLRKARLGSNWRKAPARVQQTHAAMANMRHDYVHKARTAISKNHAVVVAEDLAVKNMSASARGSIEAPGTSVCAKAGLDKAIQDQG
jgi:putative transposase